MKNLTNKNKVHMKFTQKTKYFIFGAIATAVHVPLGMSSSEVQAVVK